MRSPLEVLRESNRRRRMVVLETPLDLIRALNKEKRRRAATDRTLKRITAGGP